MDRDLFKEDILENAITQRQKERSERRESLRIKKEEQEKKAAAAAERAKKRRKLIAKILYVLMCIAAFCITIYAVAIYLLD